MASLAHIPALRQEHGAASTIAPSPNFTCHRHLGHRNQILLESDETAVGLDRSLTSGRSSASRE
jgi:hypothetical protein